MIKMLSYFHILSLTVFLLDLPLITSMKSILIS